MTSKCKLQIRNKIIVDSDILEHMFHVIDLAHSLDHCGQTEDHGSNVDVGWEGGGEERKK